MAQSLQVCQDLLGRQLSAVVFVQDYLQLQFDGSRLTLTTWPVVHRDGEFAYGEPRYRDALCGCIAQLVDVADVVEADRFWARRASEASAGGGTNKTPDSQSCS